MKIGILSLGKGEPERYIETISNVGHSVQLIPLEIIETYNFDLFDLILMYDAQQTDFSMCCYSLLKINSLKHTPVWLIKNNLTKVDRQIYLTMGVSAFLSIDYDPEEIVLMLQNAQIILGCKDNNHHLVPTIEVNEQSRSVVIDGGKEIELTKLEFRLFSLMYKHSPEVFSYDRLYKAMWEYEGSRKNAENKRARLANVIFHIRTKLLQNNIKHNPIKTVRSIGYQFVVEAQQEKR